MTVRFPQRRTGREALIATETRRAEFWLKRADDARQQGREQKASINEIKANFYATRAHRLREAELEDIRVARAALANEDNDLAITERVLVALLQNNSTD